MNTMQFRLIRLARLILIAACLLPVSVSAERPAFDIGGKVIDFGVRPLALPAVLYSEALRRDRVLHAALDKLGWRIQQHPFVSFREIAPHLGDGKLEAALLGDTPTVIALAQHDMRAVAVTKHAFASVVASRHDTIGGLRGKRIGNVANTSAHYVLHEGLTTAGLTERNVTLVDTPMNEMAAALASTRIDAFASWEPIITLALRQANPPVTIYRALGNDFLVLSQALISQEPEVARHFVAALLRAHLWLRAHPAHLDRAITWCLEAHERFAGKPSPLDKDTFRQIARRDALSIPGMPFLPRNEPGLTTRLDKRLAFLKARGQLDALIDWPALSHRLAPQLLEDVYRQAARYRLHDHDYE